jgi:hypothetical protein
MATDQITAKTTEWTEVPKEGAYVAIQLNQAGSVKVHVADDLPDADNVKGLLLQRATTGVPGAVTFGNLPDEKNVYVRAQGSKDIAVDYISY